MLVTAFGATMKGCVVREEPFVATDMFAALLADTADVLREVVDSLTPQEAGPLLPLPPSP